MHRATAADGTRIAFEVEWDGYGHWPHLVDPDRLVARVRDFVAAT